MKANPAHQTAFHAAFERAGLNTGEYRLRMLATDAMMRHHNNIERALPTLVKMINGDKELHAQLAQFYLQHFKGDLDHTPVETLPDRVKSSDRGEAGHPTEDALASSARPVREPSAEQNAADLAIKARSALTVFDRELTNTGRKWGNVTYIELDAMKDDGDLAQEIKNEIGPLSGQERIKKVRDLMKPRAFIAAMRKVGRTSNA